MRFYVAYGGFQPGSLLSASSSLPIIIPIIIFSFLLPSLSSWRWENHSVEAIPILLSPSQSCQCGEGGIIMALDNVIPSVGGRHRQERTPCPVPCSLSPNPCEIEYSHRLSGCSTTTHCVISFPQGIPSYRDRPTVAVGYFRSGHNMLTSENRYSLNKSCLNRTWV